MPDKIIITEPGLYDLAEDVYHADPVPGGSLSSSTAKKLLYPSCPAIAVWEKTHRVVKAEYEFGHAAHKMVLGRGADVKVIDHKLWNTTVAKDEVAAARAAGQIPMKAADFAKAARMAAAVKRHPVAGPLFAPGSGVAERSIFWRDPETGAWCRAMIDWLSLTPGFRPLIVDLKTAENPSLPSVVKKVGDYGYYQQDPWYRAAVESLGPGHEDPLFLFVFVGKNPPHLITIFELTPEDLAQGRARNREALDVWVACQESGDWPGYSPEIQSAPLLPWTHKTIEVNA